MKYLKKLTLRNAPRGALLFEAVDALKAAGSGAASGAAFGPWGAAIGAAGGLASSALSQLLGRSNMKKQNEMARQNILLSNELNRRNAMEQGVLLRQAVQGAGLNINADKGAFQVAGSSALAPSGQTNPQMFDSSVLQSIIDSAKAPSEIKQNLSGAHLSDVTADTNELTRGDLLLKLRGETNLANASARLANEQADTQDITNLHIEEKLLSEIENNWQQANKVKGEMNQMQKNCEYLDRQIKYFDSLESLNKAQISYYINSAYNQMMQGNVNKKEFENFDRKLSAELQTYFTNNNYSRAQQVETKARIMSMAYEMNVESFAEVMKSYNWSYEKSKYYWDNIHGARYRKKTKYVRPPEDSK